MTDHELVRKLTARNVELHDALGAAIRLIEHMRSGQPIVASQLIMMLDALKEAYKFKL